MKDPDQIVVSIAADGFSLSMRQGGREFFRKWINQEFIAEDLLPAIKEIVYHLNDEVEVIQEEDY
jgi:hypothetical protein